MLVLYMLRVAKWNKVNTKRERIRVGEIKEVDTQ